MTLMAGKMKRDVLPKQKPSSNLWACNSTEASMDKWEDIKGAVASCQDHKGLQWLCQRPLRTGQKLEGGRERERESDGDVCQSSPCHFYLFFFVLFLKMKDQQVLFVVSEVSTEWLHGTEIMSATPKSHQCHHKPVKTEKQRKKKKEKKKKIFFFKF